MKKPNPQREVDNWNRRYPVGQKVSVHRDNDTAKITKTTSQAQVLSGHSAVIWVEGISGCYLLNRVKPIAP